MKSVGFILFRSVLGLTVAPKSQVGFEKLHFETTPEAENCYPTYDVNLNLADAQVLENPFFGIRLLKVSTVGEFRISSN